MATRRRRPTAMPSRTPGIMDLLLLMILLLLIAPRRVLAQSPSSGANNGTNYGDYFGAGKFNPSTATVVAVLVIAFFFLSFFYIYLRNCGRPTDEVSMGIRFAGAAGARHRHLQRQRGLRPEVLQTFPTMEYSEVKEHKVGKGGLECAVCISEFEDDETLRLLPACNHIFHVDCIDEWLASHVTCPVCRFNLADADAVAVANPIVLDVADAGSPRPTPADMLIDVPVAGANVPHQPPDRATIANEPIAEAGEDEEAQHRKEEAMELAELGSWKRVLRSRSRRRPSKFPRSHSTGHSIANQAADESLDRYTLRLPEHVLREILARKKFHRSASCLALPTAGDGSFRPGYRAGGTGEGSSRGGRSVRGLGKSDRWPSFLKRTLSGKFSSWRRGADVEGGSVKKGESEGSTSKGRFVAIKTPFDCIGGRVGGAAGGTAKAEGAAASDEEESDTAALARRV